MKYVVMILLLAAAMTAGAAETKKSAGPAVPDLAARCETLVGKKMDLLDAATEVTDAKMVAAVGDQPAYCRVLGKIPADIAVEVRLPTVKWNGKLFMVGRGGSCRSISMESCDGPLREGYVCAVTDQGHKSTDSDDAWASDSLQASVDCGFRGTHVAAVASKAIAEQFYHEPPAHSYFQGCSAGGRMGLVEAQHFPYDFDGILVGGAPIGKAGNTFAQIWNATATVTKDGKPILTPAAVKLVSQAVLAKCDLDDGLKNGIVSDPWACKFDPAELQCAAATKVDCLTKEQVAAVRKLYQGPINAKGQPLYPGRLLPGSELNWIGRYVSDNDQPAPTYKSLSLEARYLFSPPKSPTWRLTNVDWDNDSKRTALVEAFNTDENPDLRTFKAAGGKLIILQGLADALAPPGAVIDYYKTVQRVMGGAAATDDFARLFLTPCKGEPESAFAYAKYLDDWVTKGKAPDVVTDVDTKNNITWPIYKYPLMAKYKGSGNINELTNYESVPLKE